MKEVSGPWFGMVPESLLVPLLDAAGEALRDLEAEDVPSSLRPLLEFDRRGLHRASARKQLRAALATHASFREAVSQQFLERPEVEALIDVWEPVGTTEVVDSLSDRGDLPLLASALVAAQPEEWRLALGVVIGAAEQRRLEDVDRAESDALQTRIDELELGLERSESVRAELETANKELDSDLREERGSRREREQALEREVADLRAHIEGLERQRESDDEALAGAHQQLEREQTRVRELTDEVAELRRRLAAAEDDVVELRRTVENTPSGPRGLTPAELRLLGDAADLARRLAEGLGGVVRAARSHGALPPRTTPRDVTADSESPGPQAPAHRREVPVPPGLATDSRDAVRAMVRTEGLALIVDGYNVSKRVWPDATAAEQRDRLVGLLSELQARAKVECTVVFDGDDVTTQRGGRPGVRVRFSAAGQEADDVVVEEVAALPKRVPVLVVSSDAWVREHAEAEGARVVRSETFLAALRG